MLLLGATMVALGWPSGLWPTPPSWGIGIVIFLVATTTLVYLALESIRKKSAEKFTQSYLLSITIKITVSCAFVIVFVMMDPDGAWYNALFFLIGYLIFTAAEVIFLVRKTNSSAR